MASMCDEMSVIYEDGVENGLESVVERLAEERDRITSDLQKWFVNHYKLSALKIAFAAEISSGTLLFYDLVWPEPRHPLIDLLAAS